MEYSYNNRPPLQTVLMHTLIFLLIIGITGTVSIDENGDRNADYSLLDLNPETDKFEVSPNSRYYENTSQPVLTNIMNLSKVCLRVSNLKFEKKLYP